MADLSQQLAQYLTKKGSPLASFAPDFIKAGNRYGVDPRFLVAIAGAETEFGKTGGAGRIYNPFGWGPGIRFPNYSKAIDTIAKGLTQGPYYKTRGKTTIPTIGATWAPIGAGNDPTNLNSNWTRNVSAVYRELGGNPGANVFSNSPSVRYGPDPAPRNVGGRPVANTPGVNVVPDATRTVANPLSWNRLFAIHQKNQADIFAGRSPDPNRMSELLRIVQGAIPVEIPSPANPAAPRLPGVPDGGVPGAYGGRLPKNYKPGSTYGFKVGGVDSGLVVPGGAGGDWGGSMPRALALAKAVGATPSSQKRSRVKTASGNVSDHWKGSTTSYAVDLPTSGAAGDALFKKIQQTLGRKLVSGQWNNINIGGYRYQIGWRTPGHYDHIHVGVKKL